MITTEGTTDKQRFDHNYGHCDQLRAHGLFPHYLMRDGQTELIPGNYGFNMARVYRHNRDKSSVHDNTYDENGTLIPDGAKNSGEAR